MKILRYSYFLTCCVIINGCLMPPPPKFFGYKCIECPSFEKDQVNLKLKIHSTTAGQTYIDLWGELKIINSGLDPILVEPIDFEYSYKNIKYDSTFIGNIDISKDFKINRFDQVIVQLGAHDTMRLDVIAYPKRRFKKVDFINYWKNDTLKVKISINKRVYYYKFIAEN
ncbi:hypothetical protein [Gelidibacter salicanalis]|uniref:Uncharacterized protein n=1 Tax=Gelidibacter salicanalis TaxID=291193 RepID=A0A934KS66_9FLAO|nr:hypothetical protein [Gelidibacter salicanalis]MBJ7880436.1 hypothetical protein [Gelidibacter salicanalis]